MKFSAALRKNEKTQTLVRHGVDDEKLQAALEDGAEPVRLQGWQSRVAEAYLDGKSKLERMHIWAEAHGIEVTGENGGPLLDLYERDPDAELIEQWCDHHQIQHS